MAATTVQKLVLELQSRGVNATAQELEHLATSFLKVEQNTGRSANKIEQLTKALDPLGKAMDQRARLQDLLNNRLEKGLALEDKHVRAMANAEAAVRRAQQTYGTNDNGDRGLGRYDWINLSRQFQDVVVSIAGGQRPLTVFLQQGSQISDVFGAAAGGPVAALKDFGKTALWLATNPITLLTAAIGVAGAAFITFDAQQRELEQSLNGIGRAAGVTVEQLRAIAQISGARGGLSNSQSITAAATYAGAGLNGNLTGDLTSKTRQYAGAFGLDLGAASKELASIFTDPAKGVDTLEKRLGVLDATTKRYIEDLAIQGHLVEAQKALYNAFSTELGKTTDATSALSRAWQDFMSWATRPIGPLENTMKQLRDGLSLREQLNKARGNYLYLNAQRKGDQSSYPGESEAWQKMTDLEKRLQESEQARIDAQRAKDAAFAADKARPILNATNPNIGTARELQNSAELFKSVQDNDLALKELGITREKAAEIADQMATRESRLKDASDKVKESTDAKVRSIKEDSDLKKADIAATEKYNDVLEKTGNKKLADAEAEAIRAEALAKTTKAMDDANDAARKQLELAGKSPAEQQTIRLRQQAEEAKKAGLYSQQAYALQQAAIEKQKQYDRFGSPMQDLEGQKRLQEAQQADIGKSTYDKAYDTAYLEKYNQLLKDRAAMTPEAIAQMNQYAAAHAELAKAGEETAKQEQLVNSAISEISSSAANLGVTLVQALRSGENAGKALKNVLDQIAASLLNKSIDMAVSGLLTGGLSKAGGVAGAASAGGGILSTIKSLFSFANGGVMTSAGPIPLRAYAGGGVADSPQMALFGEGRRPEAFVPLPDGRSIPVKMHGQQQQGGAKITINNMAGADVQAREMSTGEIIVTVQKMIEANNTKVPGIVANSQRRAI